MRLIFSVAMFLLINLTFAQTDFKNIPLVSPEDMVNAEKAVLEASQIILSTPTNAMSKRDLEAQLFLFNWMEKTEYTFILTESMMKCCKKDRLLGVYLAALVQGKLAYKSDFELNAVKLFVQYVSNRDMQIKQTGAIKKLIKAATAGDLSYYTK